jgi:ligand-binding SRPBCC domain-containing protein
MAVHILTTSLSLPLTRDECFDFFSRAENLGRITPPKLSFRILTPMPVVMQTGALIDYTIGLHGIPMRWNTRIEEWNPPHEFVDIQLRGPYAQWIHRHSFHEFSGGTRIDDDVRYRLPFGPLGDLVHPIVRRQLTGIFTHRQQEVARLLLGDSAKRAFITPVHIT